MVVDRLYGFKAIHPDQLKDYQAIVLETIHKTGLESAFTYGTPRVMWPERQYIKLKELKAQSDQWEMYRMEDLGDRTWAFFSRRKNDQSR